jgi:pyruvate,water dikinase
MNLNGKKSAFSRWLEGRFRFLKGKAKAQRDDLANAEKIRLQYEYFREILNLNDSTLQLIADIDDRLLGRVPFSLNLIIRRIHKALMDVFVMVRDLNRLSSGAYNELHGSLRRVEAVIDSESSSISMSMAGPLVVPIAQIRATDIHLVGSKMANLGEIKNVLGLNVSDGFAITTVAFNRFMNQNSLRERADGLEELMETCGPRVTAEACREVQKMIIDSDMPLDLEKAIVETYAGLANGRQLPVAVRSSAVGEDRAASHAGLYYTELNVARGLLLETYRWVLASAYGFGPVLYRLKHGLAIGDTQMAVGCLQMIDSRCNGIMFSRSFDAPESDKVVISVVPGPTEVGLVGRTSGHEIVISVGEKYPGELSFISDDDLAALVHTARLLESHFGSPQDIEWAIDNAGKLFILQSRPMIARPITPPDLPKIDSSLTPLITGGAVACPGIGEGTVFVVNRDSDLALFPDNGVLVSRYSAPIFAQVMNRCTAIVTEQGSPIGHMAILAREFGIPTIVGMTGVTKTLESGQEVTVDAASLKVYAGLVAPSSSKETKPTQQEDSPAIQKLRRISKVIVPLNLTDSASIDFTPDNCRSLHDITRFVHEKVFEEMFHIGDKASCARRHSLDLKLNLPFSVQVLDVGGGFSSPPNDSRQLSRDDILSVPMKAFLEGLTDARIRWDQPRSVSGAGFLSVVGESIAGLPTDARGVGGSSFAIISDRYMNFSTKAGYHFNQVDTYCGKSLNKNYIHFRFEGGAAAEIRRQRRCEFLSMVLNDLNFKVQIRGDILFARLEKYDHEYIRTRLIDLGRLTICSRQLDMLMDSDESPEFFGKAFLSGELERF